MTKQEAALWATGIKAITDMMTAIKGEPVTLENLDEAIKSEEVRSKVLERQRRDLVEESGD